MIAYHGSQTEKDAILKQLQLHYDADEIVHGTYWENGKGCAVGCTIHGSDHAQYEPRFGIPQALAHLEDIIFEGMSNGKSKEWPLRFMRAIKPGAHLEHVQWAFLSRILTDEKITPGINHPVVKDAVARVAVLCAAWATGTPIEESAAASAAWSAARSAASAARNATASAARSAASAAWSAASAARSAASAARNATSAAWSAASAARSAASAAWSAARSAASAASAARNATASARMADLLIELIEAEA